MRILLSVVVLALGSGCNHTQPVRTRPAESSKASSDGSFRADSGLPEANDERSSGPIPDAGVDVTSRSTVAASYTVRGVALVPEGGKWFCIDRSGRHLATIFPFDNGPDYVREGLVRYVDRGKIGFVDDACKIRVAAEWDFAFAFSEGRAVVCQGCKAQSDGEHFIQVGGQWGYIDRVGKVVVPLLYDSAAPFENGNGTVTLNGATLRVNLRGVVSAGS